MIDTLRNWGNGILGAWGLFITKVFNCPSDLLMWLSIIAVTLQIARSLQQFWLWVSARKKRIKND